VSLAGDWGRKPPEIEKQTRGPGIAPPARKPVCQHSNGFMEKASGGHYCVDCGARKAHANYGQRGETVYYG
jgi:hypothetical protein